MKVKYYLDTDSLYIDFSEKTSQESVEIAQGIVADFDKDHHIVGIDIDHAGQLLNLSEFEISDLPSKKLTYSS